MKQQILSALKPFEFTHIGQVPVTKPISLSFYENWLDQGLNADMNYLKDHLSLKSDLNQFLPQAQSVIVVTLDYFKHPKAMDMGPMKIASYAKGEDYHYFFKRKLMDACDELKKMFPDEHFKPSTDSQPILERDFAYQAGLGWFGKNTCIIDQKKGSYFLIGEIVSTLKVNEEIHIDVENLSKPLISNDNSNIVNLSEAYHPDRCGTCTKCIDSCPTGALTVKSLDANKCISYWTIESRSVPDIDLAKKFDSWFFGCDVCQDVCPWNIKLHGKSAIEDKNQFDRKSVLKEILAILNSSNKSLEKRYFGTPLSRARGFGLKRNALIVALNIKATEIISDLEKVDLKNITLKSFQHVVIYELKK